MATRVIDPDVLTDQMVRLAQRAAQAYAMGDYDQGDELSEAASAISDRLDRSRDGMG